ncbi:MAG TPA: 3-deoxy-D-manno-octulosonic acid transferase [Terriglobales bacterium]|nr:3-deoxy-D-manno-octulosonic acid transferase [Terriglobales bacterium]
MYLLYSALLAVAMVLAMPFWLWQMFRHGKYRTGFGERWGVVPKRIQGEVPGQVIWIHAVSVGEVLAVSGLVEKLRERFPGNRVVVSTTTDTGQKLARTKFGEQNVFYFPLDFAFAVRPYLKTLKPKLVIMAETEFWPNFLRLSHASDARVAVVNARISDHSLPGYRRFKSLLRRVLQHVDLFLTQTEEDQRRLVEIGALENRVRVSGNLKFDTPEPAEPAILSELKTAFVLENAGPVLVCGSTVEGEEEMLAPVFKKLFERNPRAVVLLAPRHPERFDPVATLLEQKNIRFIRRSKRSGEGVAGSVLLLDTIGELSPLYALADVAFVGGSLVPRGGHNILEPARYGSAIVVGEHTENFRDIVELFRKRDAVMTTNPSNLEKDLIGLMQDESMRLALGERATKVLHTQTGATERTLSALAELLR